MPDGLDSRPLLGVLLCAGALLACTDGTGLGLGSAAGEWTSLTAGGGQTCGFRDAIAYCWGGNAYGQLGDGSGADRPTPAAVAGGLRFTSLVTGGGHTCGLTVDGTAYCWGLNYYGELGDGSTANRAMPAAVAGT